MFDRKINEKLDRYTSNYDQMVKDLQELAYRLRTPTDYMNLEFVETWQARTSLKIVKKKLKKVSPTVKP